MDYKNLYLKYKTKYINLKKNIYGGTDSKNLNYKGEIPDISFLDEYLASRILKRDKTIAKEAIKKKEDNIKKIPDEFKEKFQFNLSKFIFSYLIEYGFDINTIKFWLKNKINLDYIVFLLYRMEGIIEKKHRQDYVIILIQMMIKEEIKGDDTNMNDIHYINDVDDITLLAIFIFDYNIIIIQKDKILNILKFLREIDTEEFYDYITQNNKCGQFIINTILSNPNIKLKNIQSIICPS